jgi:lipopolysaccharide assembly outer membrane protein LptD (OstA)
MPLPRRTLARTLLWLTSACWISNQAFGLGESQEPLHYSADKQIWDRKSNQVELKGHAAVVQPGETLTADYVLLDLAQRTLDAKGNCIYLASSSVIYGEEMHFNLDTHTGSVVKGRISSDSFTLRGEKIDKLGNGRFTAHWGDYTTCRDCAPSWSLEAEDVDLQFGGYAYLSNVTTRLKDAPAFWVPYLIVPLKTQRQSGLLFPSFGTSGSNGTTFILPFFWAINRSMDMTIGLGRYSLRGLRVETETRYALSNLSFGTVKAFYLKDKSFSDHPNRWGVDVAQSQELPWGIYEKLRLVQVSDNLYPYMFPNDVPGAGEAFSRSQLNFSKIAPEYSAFLSFQNFRNLLNSTPDSRRAQEVNVDPHTVQSFPSASVTANDRVFLGDRGVAGLSIGFQNFTRAAGPFDYDNSSVPFGSQVGSQVGSQPGFPAPAFRPGIDPLRQARRVSFVPSLYSVFRPLDVVSITPSVQYRGFFYDFGAIAPSLNRGYLLFQVDLGAQLERVYEFPDDGNIPRAKHLIRPILTYSQIPWVTENQPAHPFLKQIENAQKNNIVGYNFDNNDIIPIGYTRTGANYFIPQGQSLSYGFTTQWIRRVGPADSAHAVYQRAIEWSAGQSLNFLELSHPVDPRFPHPLSRLFSNLSLNYEHFNSSTTYYYYPDRADPSTRQEISTGLSVVLERATHQRILTFDRSFNLAYSYTKINSTSNLSGSVNFSINDYFLPTGSISYSFVTNQLLSAGLALKIQSPSQCWQIITGLGYVAGLSGLNWTFNWSLNLTGSGFGAVGDFANQIVSH